MTKCEILIDEGEKKKETEARWERGGEGEGGESLPSLTLTHIVAGFPIDL